MIVVNHMWSVVRLVKAIWRPSGDEFRETIDRLRRHSDIADQTAVATELLRAAKFREGILPLRCISLEVPMGQLDVSKILPKSYLYTLHILTRGQMRKSRTSKIRNFNARIGSSRLVPWESSKIIWGSDCVGPATGFWRIQHFSGGKITRLARSMVACSASLVVLVAGKLYYVLQSLNIWSTKRWFYSSHFQAAIEAGKI